MAVAALVNLERWVRDGAEPPPSAFPHLVDGTAAPAREVAASFRRLPTAVAPDPEKVPILPRLDLGPDADRGIGRFPVTLVGVWPTFVAAVDGDGNEIAGVRLPEVSQPVATYTGWNPRGDEMGGEGQILPMFGSTIPFTATAADRARTGDPRPSIAERDRDRDDYVARARAAADQPARDGYILRQDLDLVINDALARYDALAPAPVRT